MFAVLLKRLIFFIKVRAQRMELFLEENVRAYNFILENLKFLQEYILKHTELFEIP